MSEVVKLSDLRNGIEEIWNSIARERENGEIANLDILIMVKELKSNEIAHLNSQLIDIALTKLYNEVSNRKGPKVTTDAGIDLFGNYRSIPKNITIIKGKKKDISKATFKELDLWVKSHETKADERKNEELKRLIEDCRPFVKSDDDTLEGAMKRKIEAEKLL